MKPLIIYDFDGTLADTTTPSPSGMNVEQAYRLAIEEVFGVEGDYYFKKGNGFANMEPGEMVQVIQQESRSNGINIVEHQLEAATQKLVEAKLSHILPIISPDWPKMYDGVLEFFEAVQAERIPITTAIVSSGHEAFIKRVFEVNGLLPPENIVTSDSLRNRAQPQRELYKPFPFQLALAHANWRNDNGSLPINKYNERGVEKPRMMYIGNDPVKDGGLAGRSRILFGLAPFTHPNHVVDEARGQYNIGSFSELTEKLIGQKKQLVDGQSFSELLLGRKDEELFPALTEHQRPYATWLQEQRINPGRRERF